MAVVVVVVSVLRLLSPEPLTELEDRFEHWRWADVSSFNNIIRFT